MESLKYIPLLALVGLTTATQTSVAQPPGNIATVRFAPIQIASLDHARLLKKLAMNSTDSIILWQTTVPGNIATFRFPYLLFIDKIAPDLIVEDQTISVHFTLQNVSSKAIAGKVLGTIDDQPLISTTSATILSLAPGAVAEGELWTYGRKQGVHVAHLSFVDGRSSLSDRDGFNPNDWATVPKLDTVARNFKAEDAVEFSVASLGPCLSTQDVPQRKDLSAPWSYCGGGSGETWGWAGNVPFEWGPVLAGSAAITPLAGTVITKRKSGGDFPTMHPFGFDRELFVLPDSPWDVLLAPANKDAKGTCKPGTTDEICDALLRARSIDPSASGIMSVETDSLFMPDGYWPEPGSRVVIHGDWIVDCGHDDYHSEIHPPLIVASASEDAVTHEVNARFLARPFGVTQRYGVTNSTFHDHALNEVGRTCSTGALHMEAKPILLNPPFKGTVVAQYDVTLPAIPGSGYMDSEVRYHFIQRPGVTISIDHPDKYHVTITVLLSEANYIPLAEPNCGTKQVQLETFDEEFHTPSGTVRSGLIFAGGIIGPCGAMVASAAQAGFTTAQCSLQQPPIPSATDATDWDNAIETSSALPFPFVGWLRMRWSKRRVAQLSPSSLNLLHRAAIERVHN